MVLAISFYLAITLRLIIGISFKDKNPKNHLNLVKNKYKNFYINLKDSNKIEKLFKRETDFIFHLAACFVYKSIENPNELKSMYLGYLTFLTH